MAPVIKTRKGIIPNTVGPTAWGKKKMPAPKAVEKNVIGQYKYEILMVLLGYNAHVRG
ncbi:hypothetical protein MQ089_06515 [Edwardsiella anguillarum]|uniref:hypothetical protein n=1 Tax=Edwardsiella TaxID=635 RepID=UPI00045C83F1|nr:hypothetical protein [Edwardsiella anguillarum]GAJ66572.1 hypothetical protein MA13_contig00002-0281 [Edwardsiella piscicida]WHP81501.1 hypothetical protein MQ090_06500 [Edwardsiella anguillarum]WHQ19003.1 hypothetical protein MQ085_06520 [Edwardsiella anguillarum]WHQ22546.1 hypothetical protein MQ089_06515 [Edwardsiella anguillarum]WHQ26069.1 hypothetical protein MQ094_06520 [Edwardsiella anguillarum]